MTNDFVCLRKIPEDFQNNSPFIDLKFQGSLFAVLGTYFGDDMGKAYDDLKYYIENKLDTYMLDYPYINRSHIDCMGEEMLSPFNDKGRYDIYMPIKRRSLVDTHFDQPEIIKNITIDEIEEANPILQTFEIDLQSMVRVDCDVKYDDGCTIYGYWYTSGLLTEKTYSLPLRIDFMMRCYEANTHLDYGKGDGQNASFNLRYDTSINSGLSNFFIHDPVVRNRYDNLAKVEMRDEFLPITWIIGEQYFAILINNQVVYCATNLPYMSFDFSTLEPQPIKIGANNGKAHMQIKDFSISTLKYSKTKQIKKGECYGK